jgi:hypothetical protein
MSDLRAFDVYLDSHDRYVMSTLSIIATRSLLAIVAWFLLQAVRNVFKAL